MVHFNFVIQSISIDVVAFTYKVFGSSPSFCECQLPIVHEKRIQFPIVLLNAYVNTLLTEQTIETEKHPLFIYRYHYLCRIE